MTQYNEALKQQKILQVLFAKRPFRLLSRETKSYSGSLLYSLMICVFEIIFKAVKAD